MLIVAGTFEVDPDGRSTMLEAVQPMVAATLAEPGCRAYVFSPDVSDPGLVHLFELWDDQAALDGHFASDHMAAWREVAADLPIRRRDIAKYTVSDAAPLP